jgi:hypothetical protein
LASSNVTKVLPCQYQFPTSNIEEALDMATTFTDLTLGTLQDIAEVYADNNDTSLIRITASIIGQEGEQEAIFRLLQKKHRTAPTIPFLTSSTREYAFSALQQFIVPNSCPSFGDLDLPTFGILRTNEEKISVEDQMVQFNFDVQTLQLKDSGGNNDWIYNSTNQLALVYINQQNSPVTTMLQNIKIDRGLVSFEAFLPVASNQLYGLTITGVVFGHGPFDSLKAVTNATLFAPALLKTKD